MTDKTMPVRIGPYTLPSPYLLAPMAGVSELPFRRIALEMGAGLAPTELVSAEGLFRQSERTLRYLRRDASVERPFCVQLFGGDPERMAQAARVAQAHGAEIIDINMGCPVPKVTRNGAGSALLCDPARAGAVVAAVREATGLPVSAKMRSGWDAATINAVELARALEAAGAAAVTVHARTRAQGYAGKADWSVIARVKAAVSIPVIGNGDVRVPADAARLFEETGCDAVMIGRAAMGNPWIFRELLGKPGPTPAERAAVVRRHFLEHLELYGDVRAGLRAFRRTLTSYARGLKGAAQFRATAMTLEDPDAVLDLVARYFQEAEPDRGVGADLDDVDYGAALG